MWKQYVLVSDGIVQLLPRIAVHSSGVCLHRGCDYRIAAVDVDGRGTGGGGDALAALALGQCGVQVHRALVLNLEVMS